MHKDSGRGGLGGSGGAVVACTVQIFAIVQLHRSISVL